MKKGIGYEFLVRLLITIIAIASVIYFGNSLFAATKSAETSFDKFVTAIEKANMSLGVKEVDSVRLDMDEGTVIYGFDNEADKIQRWIQIPTIPSGTKWEGTYYINRFSVCPKGNSCVCLCKQRTKIEPGFEERCDNPKCQLLGGINLFTPLSQTKLVSSGALVDSEKGNEIRGGFVVYQDATEGGKARGILSQTEAGPRQRTVYIEKVSDGVLAICLQSPCTG